MPITVTENPEENTLTIVIPLKDKTTNPSAAPLRSVDDLRQLAKLILGRSSVAWDVRDVRSAWIDTWHELFPRDWLNW